MPNNKSKEELEEKVYKLKDVNKKIQGDKVKLETNLKKAQWEASYFRKKAQIAEKQIKGNNISNVEANELSKMVNSLKSQNAAYRKQNLKLRESARSIPKKLKKKQRQRSNKHSTNIQSKPSNENHQITSILQEIRQTMQQNKSNIQPSSLHLSDTENIALDEVRKQLKQKQSQIAMLTTQYNQLQSNLRADRIIQQRALKQCEKYKLLLQQTEKSNYELQQQICNLETTGHEIESLQLYIQNLKTENTSLQERIGKLTENSLLGDQLETHRISQITSKHDIEINEIENQLNESTKQLKENEKYINKLKNELNQKHINYEKLNEERNELQREIKILKQQNTKMKTKTKLFEEQSGVNIKDLECALELIAKSQRNSDQDGLDFLESIEIDKCDDPIILRAKIDELCIQNRDLILECTQHQNLLETQINLNKRLEKDYNELENDYTKAKEESDNIKSEMYRLSQTRNLSNLLISENELFLKKDIDNICFGTTENLIVFKILSGELNPNSIYFKDNSPLTMLIVDFFEFESIYSVISGGYNPQYELLCQYKIIMDDYLLNYLKTDYISIDFVQKSSNSNNKLNILLTKKISLSNLLITPDGCIQGEIELICNKTNECIGKLKYIAKMLRSIDNHYNQLKNQNNKIQNNYEETVLNQIEATDSSVISSQTTQIEEEKQEIEENAEQFNNAAQPPQLELKPTIDNSSIDDIIAKNDDNNSESLIDEELKKMELELNN